MNHSEGYGTKGLPKDAIDQRWESMITSAPQVDSGQGLEVMYFEMSFQKVAVDGRALLRAEGSGNTPQECWDNKTITWERHG